MTISCNSSSLWNRIDTLLLNKFIRIFIELQKYSHIYFCMSTQIFSFYDIYSCSSWLFVVLEAQEKDKRKRELTKGLRFGSDFCTSCRDQNLYSEAARMSLSLSLSLFLFLLHINFTTVGSRFIYCYTWFW